MADPINISVVGGTSGPVSSIQIGGVSTIPSIFVGGETASPEIGRASCRERVLDHV